MNIRPFAAQFSLAIVLSALIGCQSSQPPSEVRGVWLTNVDSNVLESRENIARAMQFLADHHFNVVFPVVWNKGFTLYQSATMDSLFGYSIDTLYSGRDPLAELIEEAHARGLAVIPWFEFGFSPSHEKSSRHILERKPEWAERDRDGGIVTKNGFHWMNAFRPEVQNFLRALVIEVVENYDVDGVQGDDRLPAQPVEGGYSDYTRNLYQDEHGGSAPPADIRDVEWVKWRAEKLTAFADKLYRDVKKLKPGITVSWSPSMYPWGLEEYLQDWPTWIRNGSADLVIPQVYRYTFAQYDSALASQAPESLGVRADACVLVPGMLLNIADYVMPEEYLKAALELNRRKGYRGEVFFFYEGLRKDNDRVATLLLSTVYKERAAFPFMTSF